MPSQNTAWWEPWNLEEGRVGIWTVGPLELQIENRVGEWCVATRYEAARRGDEEAWAYHEAAGPLDDSAAGLERYLLPEGGTAVGLIPRMADRPIVASPDVPLFLLPDEETRIFLGSPLWIAIAVQDARRVLRQVPIQRPSDSWFGPDTLRGTLCYATHTRARVYAANLPRYIRHAVTAVQIHNRSRRPLRVERIKLPVPHLDVFAGEDGRLWTQEVRLTQDDHGLAEIEDQRSVPEEAGRTHRLSAARSPLERSVFTRAFASFSGVFERRRDEA